MTILLFFIFVAECIAIIIWGLRVPSRHCQYPFLAALVFAGFMGFQIIALLRFGDIPAGSLDRFILMSILCLAMCFYGNNYAQRTKYRCFPYMQFDHKKLRYFSLALTIIGAFFYIKLNRIYHSDADMSGGLPTSLFFFATLLNYGFVISVTEYLRSRSKLSLCIALFGCIFYLDRILIQGRRGTAIEWGLVLMCSLWFVRQRSVPRKCLVVIVLCVFIWVFSIGEYRRVMAGREGPDWDEIKNMNLYSKTSNVIKDGSCEVRAAVYLMEGVEEEFAFDYGAFNWNKLIFNYVPAQILGSEFKSSFMIKTISPVVLAGNKYGYTPENGTTVTGICDSFNSFWYFGCVKFFFISYILGRLYYHACKGSVLSQLLYTLLIGQALHAITHNTQWFFSPFVHMAVFLLPGLIYIRSKKYMGEKCQSLCQNIVKLDNRRLP